MYVHPSPSLQTAWEDILLPIVKQYIVLRKPFRLPSLYRVRRRMPTWTVHSGHFYFQRPFLHLIFTPLFYLLPKAIFTSLNCPFRSFLLDMFSDRLSATLCLFVCLSVCHCHTFSHIHITGSNRYLLSLKNVFFYILTFLLPLFKNY